ncbi:hypothetical protein R1sor_005050 [Riccia sorocarpa]|uniref:Endonuclease/exonuclease/phosphatase domain-containing protein n=1 Tax=Riccia sorocarpa TaxID=122646 RepID=A0ABD3HPY3_9MARC
MTKLESITVASWNVHGLGHPDRVRAVQKWISTKARRAKVIGLQELKASEAVIEFNIRQIMESSHTIVDYSNTDRGGAALLIHRSLQITAQGVRGDGSVAWAKIRTEEGNIGIASVYGPDSGRERIRLFDWLKELDLRGKWILLGDWNMTLNKEDSIGPSPLLQGAPLRRWRALDQKGDLLDVYHAAGRTEGPFFTRQAASGNRLDQSRLDRVYLSEMRNWIHTITLVKHYEKMAVSDHVPVLVDIAIKPPRNRSRRRRSSYTKMDGEALKDPIFYEEAKKVAQRILTVTMPYNGVVDGVGETREPGSVSPEEFKVLEAKVREGELEECKVARRRSRHKWLKSGDASTRYFYAMLISKQNAEALTTLHKEDGTVLEEEEEILEEVHRFYGDLYHQPAISQD